MKQIVNKVYEPLFTSNLTYKILLGGRGAGRSTVASQYANARLVAPEYFRCAIMRLVLGDIRNSIYKEIVDRAEENGILDQIDVNESTMTLSYGANSINAVGFKKSSGEQKAKLKSLANYTDVIIEEADEISEEDFIQLDDSLRTLKGNINIILLLNPPPKTHWIIKRWFNLLPSPYKGFYIPELKPEITNTLVIRTSYKDNIKNIAPRSIENYENYQYSNPSHYCNMILGLVPETVRGKIFSNWREIEAVPFEARLIRRGLDFGYSNDPTALIDIYEYNGGYIIDEQLYRKGMLNKQIADYILNLPHADTIVVADSAEPKSIDEIKLYGVTILPATKGTGSINSGIAFIQGQRISYTKRSVNLKTEYENYAWLEDKDGVVLNKPKPGYDHLCFTKDAIIEFPIGKQIEYKLTGIKDVYEFMGSRVTSNHPYLTQRGFVALDALRYSDKIVIWKNNLLTELSLDDTQTQKGVRIVSILHLLVRNLQAIRLNASTGIYGKNKMVQYLKVFMYTTKTAIHLTISYLISNCYHLKNILQNIMKFFYHSCRRILRLLNKKQQNGIDRKSLWFFIKNKQSIYLDIKSKEVVTNVEKNTLQKQNSANSATIIAKLKHCGKEEVYSTTTTSGFFTANGVIVSNCDALRYGLGSVLSPNEFTAEAKVTYTI